MEVDFKYYISHYFSVPEVIYFFGLAFGILFLMFLLFYIFTLITSGNRRGKARREYIRIEWHVLLERFYEMIFSGTSILMFMAVYYLIDRFVDFDPYRETWDKYKDFFLMILIILSCFYNSLLDRVLIRFRFLTRDERSAGRLTGMVYMLLIFAYIKFIYENNNYDMFITYFLGLMVGRFAYFDSTIHDFVKAIDGVKKNLGLMVFALIYTSAMCLYGFKTDYLITHNGVITNVFITHLFMCAAIFLIYHLHIAELISGRGGRIPKVPLGDLDSDNVYYYETDDSGDNADYYDRSEAYNEDYEYDDEEYDEEEYYDEEYDE